MYIIHFMKHLQSGHGSDGGNGIGYIFVAYDKDGIDDRVDDDVKVGVRKDGGGER